MVKTIPLYKGMAWLPFQKENPKQSKYPFIKTYFSNIFTILQKMNVLLKKFNLLDFKEKQI